MKAVTGQIELKTDSVAELVKLVSSQADTLGGKRCEIIKMDGSQYLAEVFSSVEPIATT